MLILSPTPDRQPWHYHVHSPASEVGAAVRQGEMHIDLVVRARIATSVENLIGLRDLLAQLFPTDKSPNDIPTGAGATGKLH
jgi:hypothetical protein